MKKSKSKQGICKCGHELIDHIPEPSAGCTICREGCQCYKEAA